MVASTVPDVPGGGRAWLNVAATCAATRALGPGVRAIVWVQGCPFRCPGCVAPDWLSERPARIVDTDELARELVAGPEVTGLTFSGGEPMMQAAALARLARAARRTRDLSLICFTGFRLERLLRQPPGAGVPALLAEADVLIDGPYVAALDDGRGLRGSGNQRVHCLTDRHRADLHAFERAPRSAEIHVDAGDVLMVGVPPPGLAAVMEEATARLRRRLLPPAGSGVGHGGAAS